MPSAKLTKRLVDSLPTPVHGDSFLWDADLKGFGLRVLASGRKVFVVGYRPAHSRRYVRLTLGTYGKLTVDEARRLAKRQLASVAGGVDPLKERRAKKSAPTVSELGAAFLADCRARRKQTTATEYARLWTKHVEPSFGTAKVADVSSADVARIHRKLAATPYAANRVLALLGSFFTFAAREGARSRADNPVRDVTPYPERGRERFLTAAEFARLGESLRLAEDPGLPPAPSRARKPRSPETAKHRPRSADIPKPANPDAVAAIRLLALTGCREGEILSLRWDSIDFERGFLRLRETKTGPSVRPLGAAAAELLAARPRLEGSPFVFPGLRPGSHLSEVRRVWSAVRHAAGLNDVRLHDLRHSYASVPASGGDSLLVIRALLGHADIATTQRYAHLADDPVRKAASRTSGTIAAWLDGHATQVSPLEQLSPPRAARRRVAR